MASVVIVKLLAVFAVIALGWGAGRAGVLGPEGGRTLSAAAFGLFTPALLFRTTASLAVADLPWRTLAAYYLPTLVLLLGVYTWQRLRHPVPPAAPAIRALSLTFGNTVQLGIAVATAIFGSAGLAIHITIASLQSIALLVPATALVELDLSRGRGPEPGRLRLLRVVAGTARRTLIHPVVLPVLLGLAYHATGLPIPGPVDSVLVVLGQAVVPVSLVAIGLTLQQYGIKSALGQAVALSAGKLVLQPALVLALAYWGFGLRGLPLTIAVLAAALPIGSNVLLFAQRYGVQQAEATAAIVASTSAFLVTGTLWLLLLSHLS
ncbi:MAG: AEC family transporter [Micromonosporaceae bacterium]|nr:AEC family transporter [Micromonosporaceae bacterium]